MRRVGTIVAVLVVAGVGVAAGRGGGDENAASTAAAAQAGPKISFVSPAAGAEVMGAVNAEVMIDGFTISADHVGQAPMDGEGHLHFSMDGGTYDLPKHSGANGELAVKLGVAGKYSPSVTPSITYMSLPAGRHTLKVWLADNSHNDTGVSAQTTFTVK
jgi:hypothetical protein